MSLNSSLHSSVAAALNETLRSKYSYSRKRWDGFSAWQEHLRKSAAAVGGLPFAGRDRDLRRAVVPG